MTASTLALDVAAAALSRRRQLLVLTYHRVLASADPLLPDEVDAARFESHVRFLAEHFRILPLGEAIARLHTGSLPPRSVCITLDDGYANNCEVALPILQRHGAAATCFVATGYIDGGVMWNDAVIEAVRRTRLPVLDLGALGVGIHPLGSMSERRGAIDAILGAIKYLPQSDRQRRVEQIVGIAEVDPRDARLMMSADQVLALHRGGIEIGAHTVSHPILARLDDATAREEIAASRARLSDLLRTPIRCFAYPNGKPGVDYQRTHVSMVRAAGYEAAVSTAWGPARAGGDRWQIPRVAPWDRGPMAFGLRLLRTYLQRRIAFV